MMVSRQIFTEFEWPDLDNLTLRQILNDTRPDQQPEILRGYIKQLRLNLSDYQVDLWGIERSINALEDNGYDLTRHRLELDTLITEIERKITTQLEARAVASHAAQQKNAPRNGGFAGSEDFTREALPIIQEK